MLMCKTCSNFSRTKPERRAGLINFNKISYNAQLPLLLSLSRFLFADNYETIIVRIVVPYGN